MRVRYVLEIFLHCRHMPLGLSKSQTVHSERPNKGIGIFHVKWRNGVSVKLSVASISQVVTIRLQGFQDANVLLDCFQAFQNVEAILE